MPPERLETGTIRDEDHAIKLTSNTVTVPVPVIVHKSAIDRMTRLFAWLTACLTISAILVSLIFVTRDRDQLRAQIKRATFGLECRAKAATDVNQAITDEQVALAAHSVVVGEFVAIIIRVPKDDPTYSTKLSELAGRLDTADQHLTNSEVRLQQAVDDQKEALRVCKLG